jgi:broad specificity polyphosphatase/5'/3'-nucleotidase SurE
MRRLIPIFMLVLLLLAACGGAGTNNGAAETPMAVDQTAVDGTWTGTMDVGGVQSAVTVTFDSSIGALQGTIDIPDQGIAGQPLDAVSLAGDTVSFGVASLDLAMSGTVAGDTLSGDATQSGTAGTFALTRGG